MTELTPREKEISKYLSEGKNKDEIVKVLHVSRHTIKSLVSAILKKSDKNVIDQP